MFFFVRAIDIAFANKVKAKIAKNLKQSGMPINTIIKVTELSEEQVKKL